MNQFSSKGQVLSAGMTEDGSRFYVKVAPDVQGKPTRPGEMPGPVVAACDKNAARFDMALVSIGAKVEIAGIFHPVSRKSKNQQTGKEFTNNDYHLELQTVKKAG